MELVATLSGRFADMRGVTLQCTPGTIHPATLTTKPFFLENLVWLCLDFAMDAAGQGKSISLTGEKAGNTVRLGFTGLGGLKESLPGMFPGEREKALLGALGAEFRVDAEAKELILTLMMWSFWTC